MSNLENITMEYTNTCITKDIIDFYLDTELEEYLPFKNAHRINKIIFKKYHRELLSKIKKAESNKFLLVNCVINGLGDVSCESEFIDLDYLVSLVVDTKKEEAKAGIDFVLQDLGHLDKDEYPVCFLYHSSSVILPPAFVFDFIKDSMFFPIVEEEVIKPLIHLFQRKS
jgi:hypothetical protein